MWLFLATEVMFFGVLFTAYALYRATSPEAFAAASRHLTAIFGTVNTAVLLRYSSRLTWVFAGAGFIWLMILLGLTMNDYFTRNLAGFHGW